MKEEGLTHGMISRVLGVSEGTISRWISLYQERGLEALCQLFYEGDPGERKQELSLRSTLG
jgi:transposase